MRWVYMITCGFLFVTLVACEESLVEPVAIPDGLDTPSFAVQRDAWVETVDLGGAVVYVDCVNDGQGEELLISGTLRWPVRVLITPSGNEVWKWKIDYWTETPLSQLGLESGDVYSLVKAEDTGGSITKPKGTQYVEHWQFNEWYANEDGDKFHTRGKFRLMIDANGDVKLDRYSEFIKCPGKP